MEKFSYADEFNRVADVARIGNADDVRISYSVFVGDPDNEDEPKMPPTFQPMALLEALAVFLREQLQFSRSMI